MGMFRSYSDLESRVKELEAKIEAVKLLVDVNSHPWLKTFRSAVSLALTARVESLCSPKRTQDESHFLRGEIETYRAILRNIKPDEGRIEEYVREIEDLQKRMQRLQDIGLAQEPLQDSPEDQP